MVFKFGFRKICLFFLLINEIFCYMFGEGVCFRCIFLKNVCYMRVVCDE